MSFFDCSNVVPSSEHKHPHGVEDTQENPERVWICDECGAAFPDEEARRDCASGEWGHCCKQNPRARKPWRCEGHLEPFVLDVKSLEMEDPK